MNIQHFIKKINISRFLTCLLFLFLVVLGLKIFPDYGMGFDEPTNRRNGGISLNYVVQKYNNFFNTEIFKNDIELKKFNIPLDTYHDRDYGVAFDLPIFFIERVFEINNSKNQYLFRHISTYLIFLIGCFALFKTVKYRFSNEWLGILAVCFMVSSPRIFAESFYNIKDIVFMSFVSVTTYFFIRFVSKPNITNTIYFAIASAVSIDIRIVALIFPIAAILILLLQMCRFELSTKKGLLYITIYLLIMSLITVILWPWLWESPVERFLFAFNNMAKFRWSGWVLYQGIYFPASALPIHYMPVWLTISTPLIYVALFFLGVFAILVTTIKNKLTLWSTNEQLQDLIFIGIFFSPIILIIVQKPPLYDGWRHLYFVYPAFIGLVIRGLTVLPKVRLIKKIYISIISFLLLVSIASCVLWMIKVHPHQNLYFNSLISNKQPFGYEMDYWGLSDIKALEFILEKSDLKEIRVFSFGITSVEQAQSLLSDREQERIKLVYKEEDADFIITNFRFYDPHGPLKFESFKKRAELFFEIKVDNQVIIAVYKKLFIKE